MIYLDYNSSWPLSHKALSVMSDAANLMPLNPSSTHWFGRGAKYKLEQARESIVASLGAQKNYDLLFTSSGSEANNLVLKNFYQEQIFISAIEHLSIYNHSKYNPQLKVIKVTPDGYIDLQHLQDLLQSSNGQKKLISIIFANNETGVIQDLAPIIDLAKQHEALVHSDFSQVVGKYNCDLDSSDLDFITISSHKFGGPVGIAGLFYKKGLHLVPQVIGGGQEKGLRSGTQNVLSATAMASAMPDQDQLVSNIAHMEKLRNSLEDRLKSFYPALRIANASSKRLCNTSMIIMPGVASQMQLISFDLKDIAISSGSACSSGKIGPSHVLEACGYSRQDSACAIRVSLGASTTEQEIETFCQVWHEIFLNNLNMQSNRVSI